MKVQSIQIGSKKCININGIAIETGIYKTPINGPVFLGKLGLENDVHANLKVHGGEGESFYVLSTKVYFFWKDHIEDKSILKPGLFGENITLEDLDESQIEVNDIFELGETIIQATMPRFPCSILNQVFKNSNAQSLLRESGHPGVLFRVLQTGYIQVGDELKLKTKSGSGLGILEFLEMTNGHLSLENFEKILSIPGHPQKLIDRLEIRMREGR